MPPHARSRAGALAVALAVAFSAGACAQSFVSARAAAESPHDATLQLARVLVLVENEYVDPVERDKLVEGGIKGMVAELDPHSAYMPPRDNAMYRDETEGHFGGVGVEVELRDERVIVLAPIEGGPAERAGIVSGDLIVTVDGDSVRTVPFEKLVTRLRGKPGTSVTVEVLSVGAPAPRAITLVREEIKVKSVASKRLPDQVAYLRVKQFQATTLEEFRDAVTRLKKDGPIAKVMLDLRSNPGGLVDQAVGIADEFLDKGGVYSTRARGKILDEVSASRGGMLTEGQVVVLVNEWTASASELLAAALQDDGRATVVGAKTFGKGSVQTIYELPGGAGMRLTTMRYYTPKGHVIQAAGVTPDVLAGVTSGRVLRERDIPGHLPPADGAPSPAASADPKVARGVVQIEREIPDDPSQSKDEAVRAAWKLLTGR